MMTRRLRVIIGVVVSVGIVLIVGLWLFPDKPPIPGPIKAKLTSTLLVPRGGDYQVKRESAKYDPKLKVLTYEVAINGVGSAVVSEQPTPDSFIDIPQVYDKVVANMNEYGTFDSDIGTVHLTRPKDLGGKQAAVMNAKGTLMFVKPERDLSDDQWRKLFNGLEVVR